MLFKYYENFSQYLNRKVFPYNNNNDITDAIDSAHNSIIDTKQKIHSFEIYPRKIIP